VKAGDSLIVPREPPLKPLPATILASAEVPAPELIPPGYGIPGLEQLVHVVRPGDTLESIAGAYHATISALKAWNGIVASAIVPGQQLTIFAAAW
jgi:hypothetical protein